MLHELFASWMRLTLEWGYPGVFVMMAIESTVFPLPSEVIVPPAAYWTPRAYPPPGRGRARVFARR